MKIWENDGRESTTRGGEIIKEIKSLLDGNRIQADFRIIDVASGNANMLAAIFAAFPDCRASAIDYVKFPEWQAHDFPCIQMSIQDFMHMDDGKYDVVMMMNSYRNWRGSEKEEFDRWVQEHARYFLTSLNAKHIGEDTFDLPMMLFDIRLSK